ncbi:MAG: GNAT family N-acetyltransferase [Spirochaetota bacterium]|nr:GNAT family N-acetyltransferase [Spirochaetota bacterium]
MNHIKKATIKDFTTVKELNTHLKIDIKNFYWNSDHYIKSAINEQRCYVIKVKSVIKGAVVLEDGKSENNSKRCLKIGTIVVAPKFRREGLGTRLVEFVKRIAYKDNKRLRVESFYEYGRLHFYKELGFKEDIPGMYEGKPYYVLFFNPRNIPDFPEMKRIGIEDRLEYISYLQTLPVVPSDVTFENIFVFDSPSRQIYLSLMNDNVVVFTKSDEDYSIYPIIGVNKISETVLECLDWLHDKTNNGRFTCVPCNIADDIESRIKDKLNFIKDRDNYDYLYDPKTLIYFNSPGLQKQRQNLKKFLGKNPELKIINPSMIKEVLSFQNHWMINYLARMKRDSLLSDVIIRENEAIRKALTHFIPLDVNIGGIYLDGVLQGFTIVEIFKRTAYVHFEKASRKRGAYQALIHLFGQAVLQEYVDCINREQDLGIPGLRAMKKKYNPINYIEKCDITLR